MSLVEITSEKFDIVLSIAYATANNFTGKPVYKRGGCYLHKEAEKCLKEAIALANVLGYKFKILDAFRPSEAQWILWNHTPEPEFLADPRRGSPHSRGIAVDLTLIDGMGRELDMGTSFDTFSRKSHHGSFNVSPDAQRNRHLLMGIMTTAGWDFYRNEWWHYQLFNSKDYPLLSDSILRNSMMSSNVAVSF